MRTCLFGVRVWNILVWRFSHTEREEISLRIRVCMYKLYLFLSLHVPGAFRSYVPGAAHCMNIYIYIYIYIYIRGKNKIVCSFVVLLCFFCGSNQWFQALRSKLVGLRRGEQKFWVDHNNNNGNSGRRLPLGLYRC